MLIAMAAALSAPVSGQGRIANAIVETHQLAQPLEREILGIADRGTATWVGYRIQMVGGRRHMCCYDSLAPAGDCCGACRLERGGGITLSQPDGIDLRGTRITVEPPADMIILARLDDRTVVRIRTFTPDCDLDADGMPLVWLENVTPGESAAWLAALTQPVSGRGDRENRVVQPAIAALALHPGQPALGALVALAKSDGRTRVRAQALFWLAERAGQEAAGAIADAVANDPDTQVKRRAVFALSRLPKDEGIPLLIGLARTNGNHEVRKQAMFWLGQSNDARAVGFFQEILQVK